jgi:hypothetical protein
MEWQRIEVARQAENKARSYDNEKQAGCTPGAHAGGLRRDR